MLNSRRLWLVTGLGVALLFGPIRSSLAADRQFLHGHIPQAVSHLQPTGRYPGTNHLNLAIGLPLRNEAALDDLLQQIYDPASPNFRQYLTPEQFAEMFGPTEQDYQTLIAFAEKNGLTVTGTHPNRTLLDVSGSVADVERIFHVAMHTYRHPTENRTFFAPNTEPSIDLAIPILHISGLDNFIRPRPMNLRAIPLDHLTRTASATGSGPHGLYMGNDFRAAYAPGVSLNGSGQVVGLLELDGYYTSDITNYEHQAGLTNVPLQNVYIDSFFGNAGVNNDEVALDIEMAIAMAPGLSTVIVYEETNGGNVVDMLNRMATDNLAKQISSSWLIGDNASLDTAYKQFATQGQSFFQASGDDGAYYSGIAQWADDTNITLVGGTTLSTSGPGGSWLSETVWNWYSTGQGTAGSGGGINLNSIPIPGWQQGINMTTNKGSTTLRNVPDVALTADNIYVIHDNGQSGEDFGGTSCAAPLWAGFTALINQDAAIYGKPAVGFINPAVYAIGKSTNFTADFHDIMTGNNTNTSSPNNYFAVPGYDLCTGWGTPGGLNLINTFVPPDTLQVTPLMGFNSSGASGGPFNVTSQSFGLTNLGTGTSSWSLINTSVWLNFSSTSGTLASGSGVAVTASLNTAASNLVVSVYTASVWFTNRTTTAIQNRQFTLQVLQPLAITPTTGFAASGPAGGPFNVTSQNFSLTNIGTTSLNWSIINTSLWFNASPPGGTLTQNGSSATVTVSLNTTANSLTSAVYTASLWFTNLTGYAAQSVPFTLQVGQSIVQNGGFETGDFSFWSLNGDASYYNYVDNGSTVTAITPHSGSYFEALGESGFLAYLSQSIPTFAGQSYLLSLWMDSPNISHNTPNEFSVSWNGNTLFDQVNIGRIGWTNLQFIVTATSSSTVLQFGARDDNYYLGLDDINVWPIPASFRSVVKTNGNNLVFSWNSLSNIVYQVQYSTNLTTTNWVILTTNTATGPIMAYTNAFGSDPWRFYRIRRLP